MEDLDHNIHLKNLSMQQSINEEEALKLLFLGDTNRVIAEVREKQIFSEWPSSNKNVYYNLVLLICPQHMRCSQVNHRFELLFYR